MHWVKDINVIIFDMDGTLYQDYSFMGRYISKMMTGLYTDTEIEETVTWAYEILEGKKAIKLGFLYDPNRFVFYSHENLEPVSSFNWTGLEIKLETDTKSHYSYIGDPWGIAHLVAENKQIPPLTVKQAFNDVRTEMLTEAHLIIKRTDLFEEIRKLENKRLILMTNTPLPSGQEFVDFLGIEEIFDEVYFDGKKPAGIETLLEELLAQGYEPREILSVGDHPWNDLYPVQRAGGHTCLISQYEHEDTTEWSKSVRSIDELVELIKTINEEEKLNNRKEETYG